MKFRFVVQTFPSFLLFVTFPFPLAQILPAPFFLFLADCVTMTERKFPRASMMSWESKLEVLVTLWKKPGALCPWRRELG